MEEYSPEYINELWSKIDKDAQEIIAREPMLEDLVDDVVIKSNDIFEAISKRMARKLGQNAIFEHHLLKLFARVFVIDADIRKAIIENIVYVANYSEYYNTPAKVLLYSRKFQITSAKIMSDLLLAKGKEDVALYIKGLCPVA